MIKHALCAAVLSVGVGATVVAAPQVSAVAPNTVTFSTQGACEAAKPQYSTSFTRIVQGCTYSGPKLFGKHLADGPWFLVYVARTN